jgi:hypothetical protein
LQQALKKNIYNVDCENGVIYGKDGKPLGSVNNKGYLAITFRHKGRRWTFPVHQIIAIVGGLNILDPMTTNHIDGNKLNNRLSNLEAITNAENIRHAFRLGLMKSSPLRGERNPGAKLNKQLISEAKRKYQTGKYTYRKLAREYGVDHSTLLRAIQGQSYVD